MDSGKAGHGKASDALIQIFMGKTGFVGNIVDQTGSSLYHARLTLYEVWQDYCRSLTVLPRHHRLSHAARLPTQ